MLATHAGVHDEWVAEAGRLTGLDGRRTDGRRGWSTAPEHLDLRGASQTDRSATGVGQLELRLYHLVKWNTTQVDRRR